MAKTIHGILVDPHQKTVSAVRVPAGLKGALAMLDCEQLDFRPMNDTNHILVDAEGLGKPGQKFFRFMDSKVVIGGKALILGNDHEGSPLDTDFTVDEVTEATTFLNVRFVRIEAIDGGLVDTPLGVGHSLIRVPIFEDLDTHEEAPAATPQEPQQRMSFWTVTRDTENAVYVATMFHLTPQGPVVSETRLENESLDELRGMLPKGLSYFDRSADDHVDIIETWASLH